MTAWALQAFFDVSVLVYLALTEAIERKNRGA